MVLVIDRRLLAFTAIVTVAYQLLFFVITYACRFDTLTDFAGGTNFLVLSVLTLVLGGHYFARQVVLSLLVVAWALRLSGFLLFRILLWGEDRRFDDKRNSLLRLAAFWSFQALWVWTVSLPVTVLNSSPRNPRLAAPDYIGWVIFVGGLALESIADIQKLRFKQRASGGRAKWVDVGVWKWSRHPNYFGEILLWVGAFIATTRVLVGPEWAAIVSPIFIILLLLFVSGLPLVEQSADQKYGSSPDYRAYKARTSILFMIPPFIYQNLPSAIKSSVLLDWPMYNTMNKTQNVPETRPSEESPINSP